MSKTRIFVASSTAARTQAKALIKGCQSPHVEFVPWWDEFVAGRTLLEELTRIKNQFHRAVIVLTPESKSTIRSKRVNIPNLNVLFEFGFFYAALGKDKVAVVKYGSVYLPSDLDGYIHVFGSKFFKRGASVVVGKRTKREFVKWLTAP